MNCELVAALDERTRSAVEAMLRNFNAEKNPDFFHSRELPQHAPNPLNVVARSTDGKIIGGLLSETQFAWLRVQIVAVAVDHRKSGIGRQMMALAEAEAVERGCRYSFLDTMDYQAPEFYGKLGYEVAGVLENWDSHGHTKYLFTKRLI